MKILFAILFFVALTALGQSDGNFLGVSPSYFSHPTKPTPDELKRMNFLDHHIPMDGIMYRKVNGVIYNVSSWNIIGGTISYKDGDFLILQSERYGNLALKNYPGDGVDGKEVEILAMRIGVHEWADSALAAYDCGTVLTPVEMNALIKKQQALAATQAAERKQAIEIQQQKTFASALRRATNGDVYAQYLSGNCRLWRS